MKIDMPFRHGIKTCLYTLYLMENRSMFNEYNFESWKLVSY